MNTLQNTQTSLSKKIERWQKLSNRGERRIALANIINTEDSLSEVVCAFASHGNIDKLSFLHSIEPYSSEFCFDRRPIKTVALYYRSISQGGAQRVVAQTANLIASHSSNCRIILITEEESAELDYPLSDLIIRVTLPKSEDSRNDKYGPRAAAWGSILDHYKIDLLIDSMWVDECTMWDVLCIKSHPSHPALLLHCHCAAPALFGMARKPAEMLHLAPFLDGAVCLSDADEYYWRALCGNIHVIPNSIHRPDMPVEASFDGDLLWIGRISEEKQPDEALQILRFVISELPTAQLRIVGPGSDEAIDRLKKLAESLGVLDSVRFEGYSPNVDQFYAESSVLISTSAIEGYQLTLYEGAAHGLPTVLYDLPYLPYYTDIRGFISIEQGDAETAARAVVSLLTNRTLWDEASNAIKQSFSHLPDDREIFNLWKKAFDSVEKGSSLAPAQGPQAALLRGISDYQSHATAGLSKKLQQTYREKSEINAKLQQTYREKSEINAKLQQTYREKSERGETIREQKETIQRMRKRIKSLKRQLETMSPSGETRARNASADASDGNQTKPKGLLGKLIRKPSSNSH